MKKTTLVLATLLCFVTAVKAQTYVGNFDDYSAIFSIPGCFTNNGHSNVIVVSQNDLYTIYDNDLITSLSSFNFIDLYDISEYLLPYQDLSGGISTSDDGLRYLVFTQTLFNDDDNYEYIEPCETGWHIKSIEGSILQTINVDEGYQASSLSLVKIDDLIYLFARETISGPQLVNKMLIYRIDQTTGITKIETPLPISVFPTMPTREQQITVELGEDTNVNEITVVNSLGQVVKHLPLEEGQRTVTIPANELGSGLNVVNARNGQGQGSCKIIVR